MNYFLDSNICIYSLKGISEKLFKKILSIEPNNIKIPSIVKAELLLGAEKSLKRKENLKIINEFLTPFEIVSFDSKAAEKYSIIRADLEKKGKIIGPNDLIIAATVSANSGILITNNTKEFKRVKNLLIENWI